MSYVRILVSFVAGSAVVLVMLVVGLRVFYSDDDQAKSTLEAFEVDLLTREEAARLLGEDPFKRRLPDMPLAVPQPQADEAEAPEQAEPPGA
ncbi:MAG: hypothetical protein OEQ74_02625 [Gammaproteobacteria bacterium]|nr:hypothetical protein [Gammaproteobacteria bacterium]